MKLISSIRKGHVARGFTLIELLVVIAIIGILSSVVLASLNTARQKGADAKIQEQLKSVQNAAEVYATDHSNKYGTATDCTGMKTDTKSGMATLLTAANWPNATAPTCTTDATYDNYAIFHALASDSTKYWCVDNTGKSENSGTTNTGTACP